MTTPAVPDDLAQWLLTQYALRVIDAVVSPSPEGDRFVRTLDSLPTQWNEVLRSRIELLRSGIDQLPR